MQTAEVARMTGVTATIRPGRSFENKNLRARFGSAYRGTKRGVATADYYDVRISGVQFYGGRDFIQETASDGIETMPLNKRLAVRNNPAEFSLKSPFSIT